MSKIRSALFGSIVLALCSAGSAAFAQEDGTMESASGLPPMCIKGSQCTGNACATIHATSDVTSYIYGFKAYKQDDQNFGKEILQCGAWTDASFGPNGFKVSVDNPVKFGVLFGGMFAPSTECQIIGLTVNDRGYVEVRENISIAYHVTTNPNACTVTRVQ